MLTILCIKLHYLHKYSYSTNKNMRKENKRKKRYEIAPLNWNFQFENE